jgi:SAM-dependent methyltransferase
MSPVPDAHSEGAGSPPPGFPPFEPRFSLGDAGGPPWEIGRPQPAIVMLAADGHIKGPVLDVGCGTGENALYVSSLGHEVVGVDSSAPAIDVALAAARERRVDATFEVCDALELERLHRTFATVITSGLFQTLDADARSRFVESLTSVLAANGTYYQLVISDREPGPLPRNKVTQAQITDAFGEGWQIDFIREVLYETRVHPDGARAWLSSIRRL